MLQLSDDSNQQKQCVLVKIEERLYRLAVHEAGTAGNLLRRALGRDLEIGPTQVCGPIQRALRPLSRLHIADVSLQIEY